MDDNSLAKALQLIEERLEKLYLEFYLKATLKYVAKAQMPNDMPSVVSKNAICLVFNFYCMFSYFNLINISMSLFAKISEME